MDKKKIGFALGGGGARGLAQIGVIKVLAEAGIIPDIIVGASIGALTGALYGSTGDCNSALSKIHEYFHCECYTKIKFNFLKETEEESSNDGLLDSLSRYLRKKFFYNVVLANQQSFVPLDDFMENLAILIDDIDLRDTKIPLAVVCTDINAGEEVVLTEGPLRTAVAASSAIPGIFPPINYEGLLLVDGGWVNQLPVNSCREQGADFIIAISVARELEQDFSVDTGLDILRRTNAITRNTLSIIQAKDADFVISPEVGNISWAGFECVKECIERGEETAKRILPALKQKMGVKSPL